MCKAIIFWWIYSKENNCKTDLNLIIYHQEHYITLFMNENNSNDFDEPSNEEERRKRIVKEKIKSEITKQHQKQPFTAKDIQWKMGEEVYG